MISGPEQERSLVIDRLPSAKPTSTSVATEAELAKTRKIFNNFNVCVIKLLFWKRETGQLKLSINLTRINHRRISNRDIYNKNLILLALIDKMTNIYS